MSLLTSSWEWLHAIAGDMAWWLPSSRSDSSEAHTERLQTMQSDREQEKKPSGAVTFYSKTRQRDKQGSMNFSHLNTEATAYFAQPDQESRDAADQLSAMIPDYQQQYQQYKALTLTQLEDMRRYTTLILDEIGGEET